MAEPYIFHSDLYEEKVVQPRGPIHGCMADPCMLRLLCGPTTHDQRTLD